MIGELGYEQIGSDKGILDNITYYSGLAETFADLPPSLVPVIEEALVGGEEAASAELLGQTIQVEVYEGTVVRCAAQRCSEIIEELTAQRQREINTAVGRGC